MVAPELPDVTFVINTCEECTGHTSATVCLNTGFRSTANCEVVIPARYTEAFTTATFTFPCSVGVGAAVGAVGKAVGVAVGAWLGACDGA